MFVCGNYILSVHLQSLSMHIPKHLLIVMYFLEIQIAYDRRKSNHFAKMTVDTIVAYCEIKK